MGLKRFRVILALAFFAALTWALVDFRGMVPVRASHWLASTQFVPSMVALVTGASVAVAGILILLATLLFGRVYCSVLCPLGILQDVITRIARWLHLSRRPLPFRKAVTWLRRLFLWGSVAGIAAGWSGFTLALVDPYSNFGRIAADVLRPALVFANNAVTGVANSIGITLYRADVPWAGIGVLAAPALVLTLVVVMAAWRGRLYCNTVCPVGTLLGWIAQRAAFRLAIDRDACSRCADCMRSCKAQCIDLRAGAIDFSRCVACYNCVGACSKKGIGYRFAWLRKSKEESSSKEGAPDPQRRAFIASAAAALLAGTGVTALAQAGQGKRRGGGQSGASRREFASAVCPPGAVSVDRFLERCTSCHLCVTACPTHVLQPSFLEYGTAGFLKPRMDFITAFCDYSCVRCSEVCPDGALDVLDVARKHTVQIGLARLNLDHCVVKTQDTDCGACAEHCPTQAVHTVPYGDNLRLPELTRSLCIGCGACEYACPAQPKKAIVVSGLREHGVARQSVEPKAKVPKAAADLPF